jgi:oxygen-independent coproporphyrinogen-3 oxidase
MDYIQYANNFYRQKKVDTLNKVGFSRTLTSFHLVDMYPSIKAMEKFSDEIKWKSLFKESSSAIDSAAIYVHFPFCDSFCTYCHLYKEITPKHSDAENRYITALIGEIELYAGIFAKKLNARSIYFGGGTPSLMSTTSLTKIISAFRSNFNIKEDCPISFEIYPSKNINERETIEKLKILKAFGVKEIILDQQSTNDASLAAVGRGNTNIETWKKTVELVSNVADFRIKSSLILGLPYDGLESFERSVLDIAGEKKLSTVSLFLMEFRKGLKIYDDLVKNKTIFCEAAVRDKMQVMARKILRDFGFNESPIHFFTRSSQNNRKKALIGSCTSHLLGFGPSAYGHIALGKREISYYNVADTCAYQKRISKNALPISRIHHLTAKQARMAELIDDLSSQGYTEKEKTGEKKLRRIFAAFEKLGLVEFENDRISVTELGKIRIEEMSWHLYDAGYRMLQRNRSNDGEIQHHNYITILPKADENKFERVLARIRIKKSLV